LSADLDLFHKITEIVRVSTSPHQLLVDLQREFDLERERDAVREMDLKRQHLLRKMENRLTGTSFFRDFFPGRYYNRYIYIFAFKFLPFQTKNQKLI